MRRFVGDVGSALCLLSFCLTFTSPALAQLVDITQPGDRILASSTNSPPGEGVGNAIDNGFGKYLNFDGAGGSKPVGFTVWPRIGLSVVSGLTLTSANDAPERDPAFYKIEGSYDGSSFVPVSAGTVPLFTARYQKQTLLFNNELPYLAYRVWFTTPANPATANSIQISEVELLGVVSPLVALTRPGDPIAASSANSPGSEGVLNVIDGTQAKYLNFDKLNAGFTVTPSMGGSRVMGFILTSADDAPERDPASYLLEGSVDGVDFQGIAAGAVPAFPGRYTRAYVFFENQRACAAYRLTFPTVVNAAAANSMQVAEVELLGLPAELVADITQPGDPIVASSGNSPGSQGVLNAIDGTVAKYLNFDGAGGAKPVGCTVSPRAGLSLVTGVTVTSADDAPERDPASYVLEGSYDGKTFAFIASGGLGPFTGRLQRRTSLFNNWVPYLIYRLTFPAPATPSLANSIQVAEVEILGVISPMTDVTSPGDRILASSTNSPPSALVAGAIDDQASLYINRDKSNTGFTVYPSVGQTVVSGLTLTSGPHVSANDPASYRLEGTINGTDFVTISSGSIPAFPARSTKLYITFYNLHPFLGYHLIFPAVTDSFKATAMEIEEVELLGTMAGTAATLPPVLSISRAAGASSILISWPPGYAAYRLQTSTTLAADSWLDVAGVVSRDYLDPSPTGRRFYRMQHR